MYAWNLCGGSINWYKMFFIQTLPNMYAKPRTLYWKFRLNEKITLINVYVFTCQTGLQREHGGTYVGNNILLPYLVVVPNRDKHPKPHHSPVTHALWAPAMDFQPQTSHRDPCSIGTSSHYSRPEPCRCPPSCDYGREAGLRWGKPVD